MFGWKQAYGRYASFRTSRKEFSEFGVCVVTERWNCDIQDVTGLLTSKSDLTEFDSLDTMARTNSPEMVDAVTHEKMHKNLAHREIRIIHHKEKSTDSFARYAWNPRLFLMNSGGSHHFSAARYIASSIQELFTLTGTLRHYSINQTAVDSLTSEFDMFAIVVNFSSDFNNAMSRFQATYLVMELPHPFCDGIAIFLPKAESRSMKVSKVMRTAGITDLTAYLKDLVDRQKK